MSKSGSQGCETEPTLCAADAERTNLQRRQLEGVRVQRPAGLGVSSNSHPIHCTEMRSQDHSTVHMRLAKQPAAPVVGRCAGAAATPLLCLLYS